MNFQANNHCWCAEPPATAFGDAAQNRIKIKTNRISNHLFGQMTPFMMTLVQVGLKQPLDKKCKLLPRLMTVSIVVNQKTKH